MQNLMGAYSEARTLRSMYANTGKLESEFTFRVREKEFDKIDDALNELKRLYKKRCDELNNQITNSTTVSKG